MGEPKELFISKIKILELMREILIVLCTIVIIFNGLQFIYNNSGNRKDELIFSDETYSGRIPKINGEVISINNDDYNFEDLTYILGEKAIIFPKEIICNDALYFNYNRFVITDAGYQYRAEIFLEINYNDIEFNQEVARLSNVYTIKDSVQMKSVYCIDLFDLPSFVCIYNYNGEFEYALVDESNKRILYIYLKDIKTVDNIIFDKKYAPSKSLSDSLFPKCLISGNYYNIFF